MTCDTLTAPYDEFIAEHGDTLRALLPDYLHGLIPFKVEQFGPLTKYTLGQLPDERWAMLHHLREADDGPPHCHPCQMGTRLFGPYVERLYLPGGRTRDVLRPADSFHVIEPECIHKLIALPEGPVWTLVLAGPVVREWRHYPELG
jgi:hypothetical protein